MKPMKWAAQLMLVMVVSGLVSLAAAQDVVHIVSGVVTKIDKDAKTIGVKTEDGTEHVFKYTEKTGVRGYKDAEKGAKIAAGIPVGRVASAREIAGPVLFLCTPLAGFISGEVLNVNGGSVLVG